MNSFWRGAAAALLLACTQAQAADIKVLASVALTTTFQDLGPMFEKASGHKLDLALAPYGILNKRVADGEAADLVITSDTGIEALIKDGKVVAGSRVDIAQSGMGLAVKAGAPKPDISTAEAFKRTLLGAKSIAYTEPTGGGASSVNFAKAVAKLGIGDQIKPKQKLRPGVPTAELVARGEADYAAQQVSELKAVPGVDVYPFPAELQTILVLSSGVLTNARTPDAARALVRFLASPEAVAIIKDKGLEPGGPVPLPKG
jgi:molybdate transport system substrate-binding protein